MPEIVSAETPLYRRACSRSQAARARHSAGVRSLPNATRVPGTSFGIKTWLPRREERERRRLERPRFFGAMDRVSYEERMSGKGIPALARSDWFAFCLTSVLLA